MLLIAKDRLEDIRTQIYNIIYGHVDSKIHYFAINYQIEKFLLNRDIVWLGLKTTIFNYMFKND